MNKRQNKKIKKNRNLKRMNIILKELGQELQVTHKIFGNGYFLFYHGQKAVCHFSLKETPDWRYGIWLNSSNKGYSIFGEHEELIDKFKPTGCYFSFEDEVGGFIEKIRLIQKSPKLYFVDSMSYGYATVDYLEENDGYPTGYQVVRKYNEETKLYDIIQRDKSITQEMYVNRRYDEYIQEKLEREIKIERDRKLLFDWIKQIPNSVEEIICVGLKDNNTKHFIMSPRYVMMPVIKSDISQDRLEEIYNELEGLVDAIEEAGETREHKVAFEYIFDNTKDIKDCHYKYFKSV